MRLATAPGIVPLAALGAVTLAPAPAQAFATSGAGKQAMARPDERALRANRQTESNRVMQAYARCMVARSRAQSRAFAALTPGTAEAAQAGARLARSPERQPSVVCLADGDLRMTGPLLWGAISGALYERDFADRPAIDLTSVQVETDAPPPDGASREWQASLAMHRYANCVTRLNSGAVRTLALSTVGSPEETAAIAGLQPYLSACLSSGEVRFSRASLRAYLSGSLYQLTQRAVAQEVGLARNEQEAVR